jgi:hypothetical protein
LTSEKYLELKQALRESGYEKEIIWAESVAAPKSALAFFFEYAWVVLNSGMKNQVAHRIWYRLYEAMLEGCRVTNVFKHPGKAAAIQNVWDNREEYFNAFNQCPPAMVLDWLQTLPWIGPITKFHLAKNLGLDFCKPDRHLVRIAGRYGKTPEELWANWRRRPATG